MQVDNPTNESSIQEEREQPISAKSPTTHVDKEEEKTGGEVEKKDPHRPAALPLDAAPRDISSRLNEAFIKVIPGILTKLTKKPSEGGTQEVEEKKEEQSPQATTTAEKLKQLSEHLSVLLASRDTDATTKAKINTIQQFLEEARNNNYLKAAKLLCEFLSKETKGDPTKFTGIADHLSRFLIILSAYVTGVTAVNLLIHSNTARFSKAERTIPLSKLFTTEMIALLALLEKTEQKSSSDQSADPKINFILEGYRTKIGIVMGAIHHRIGMFGHPISSSILGDITSAMALMKYYPSDSLYLEKSTSLIQSAHGPRLSLDLILEGIQKMENSWDKSQKMVKDILLSCHQYVDVFKERVVVIKPVEEKSEDQDSEQDPSEKIKIILLQYQQKEDSPPRWFITGYKSDSNPLDKQCLDDSKNSALAVLLHEKKPEEWTSLLAKDSPVEVSDAQKKDAVLLRQFSMSYLGFPPASLKFAITPRQRDTMPFKDKKNLWLNIMHHIQEAVSLQKRNIIQKPRPGWCECSTR